MAIINKQKFLAELTKLISYMSLKDREAVVAQYAKRFDEAGDDEEVIAELGTPTQVAISLAGSYIPSPMDDLPMNPGEAPQTQSEIEETPAQEREEELSIENALSEPVQTEQAQNGYAESSTQGDEPVFENADTFPSFDEAGTETAAKPLVHPRRYKPVWTTIYTFFAIIIGLPITIVLICIGLPFITVGAAAVSLTVWLFVFVISGLSMVSDILFCAGIALAVCAVALVVFWFGLWLSIRLAEAFISGCVLRLGRKICVKAKKEAAE